MSVKFTQTSADSSVNSPQNVSDSGHCLQGLNLLGHSQLIELFIGSECGGQGRCGKDRVQLREDQKSHFNPPNEIERRHISPADLQSGWRLACQCFPSRDGLDLTVGFKG